MLPLVEFLIWMPVITLLVYIPLVCWLDWKYREIEPYWWIGLAVVNAPALFLLYLSGAYVWWMFVLSIVAVAIYYGAMLLHYIEGADFMFIMFIMLFFIYNPVSGHWLMALPFTIFFATCTGISGIWIGIWNTIRGKGFVFDFNGHVPMMLPISAALILTVMLA